MSMTDTPTQQAPQPAPQDPSAAVNAVGKMEVSHIERGMPVFRWKSAAQQNKPFTERFFGQNFFLGLSVASFAILGLRVTGLLAPVAATGGGALMAGAMPFMLASFGILAVGGIIGGMINSHSVDKQCANGFEFNPPSRINAKTIEGMMHGAVLGAGMTILGGALLKGALSVVGASSTGFLSQAAAVMSPSAMGLTGAAAMSMFTIPLIIGGVAALYMGYKRSKEQEAAQAQEYQQAAQIYRVQEGHVQSKAPVAELETRISETRTRNYAPETATLAGVAVGAAALGALGAGVHHEIMHAAHDLSHEAVSHTIMHASKHSTAHAATAASAAKASASFAERYAPQADMAERSFAERVGANTTQSREAMSNTDRLIAARQSATPSAAATLA